MDNNIYVVGHKNPDTDSICSALAYADLKKRCGDNAVACRLGPLNEETKFVLKRFGLENPLLLKDARSQLCDIDMDNANLISEDASMNEAWKQMLSTTNRSLFVLDKNKQLVGIVSTSNLSLVRLLLAQDLEDLMATATLASIVKTIDGKIEVEPVDFVNNGKVLIITLRNSDGYRESIKNSICILSDGKEKQEQLIKEGAKCMVITCGQSVSPEIKALAKEKDCALISTDLDTMNVAKVIYEAYPIKHVMTRKIISFNEHEFVEDVASKMSHSRVRSYPVLDDDGNVVAAVSRYHLQNYRHKHFILVDHSARNQAINNIDKATIDEIIDHHHIGNIETDYPINYRNQKCGCTCTIISLLYQENGLLPDEQMSGILLSAILSDTLNFKSATTTKLDQQTAFWLAKRANIDNVEAYAKEMLSASVSLKDASSHEILNRDLKTYDIGKYHLAIGQTNYQHIEDIQSILPEFRKNLEKEQQNEKYDLMVMMFTHVMAEGTMFVFYGPLSYIMFEIIGTKFDDNFGYDADIISRKQQLMPKLSALMKEI